MAQQRHGRLGYGTVRDGGDAVSGSDFRGPSREGIAVACLSDHSFQASSMNPLPLDLSAPRQQVWAYFARAESPARAYASDFEYYDPAQPTMVRIHVGVRGGDSTPARTSRKS